MNEFDCYTALLGMFRFSSQKIIPADSLAISDSLFNISREHPDFLKTHPFNPEDVRIPVSDAIDDMMIDGLLSICGYKFENFFIEDKLIECFGEIEPAFSDKQIDVLKKASEKMPTLMKKNKSARYLNLLGNGAQ